MSDVAAFTIVRFMVARARLEVAGFVRFQAAPSAWSEAGLREYAAFREGAESHLAEAVAVGFSGICLEDGVAIPVLPNDERPHWPILGEAAVDLFTAQIALLATER